MLRNSLTLSDGEAIKTIGKKNMGNFIFKSLSAYVKLLEYNKPSKCNKNRLMSTQNIFEFRSVLIFCFKFPSAIQLTTNKPVQILLIAA